MQNAGGAWPVNGVQSVERALSIVKLLAEGGNSGARLTDIAESVGLTMSTAHRILQALIQAGAVDQAADSGLYFLGYNMLCWGAAAGNRIGFVELAEPSLELLAERTGDTVFLSVRDRYEAVCIASVEGAFPIRTLTLKVGDRRPLGVGAGSLAILAALDEEDQRHAIKAGAASRAGFPGFDETTLWNLIEDTRRAGCALNESRVVKGMSAIALPISDRRGVIGAISVAAISERMRPPRRQNILTWLEAEAKKIEAKIRPIDRNVNLARRSIRT